VSEAHKVLRDLLALWVLREQTVSKVLRANQARRVNKALKASKAHKENKVLAERWVRRVFKVYQDRRDCAVKQDLLAHKASRVNEVLKVNEAHKVIVVFMVNAVFRGSLDQKVSEAAMVKREQQELVSAH
jgi:hypothetical protein